MAAALRSPAGVQASLYTGRLHRPGSRMTSSLQKLARKSVGALKATLRRMTPGGGRSDPAPDLRDTRGASRGSRS
ncbi:MAG: hypothetical protein MZV64_06610, partial [Ignavibacteriales bacterium]|nr:hypothetical protein [Ignavibacteriales bacterium]